MLELLLASAGDTLSWLAWCHLLQEGPLDRTSLPSVVPFPPRLDAHLGPFRHGEVGASAR